ncbi:MAG: O-antigen ligase family protein [Bacteroidales bacterium]|nr:O-antigen ligase family protein [Bacteroidales bacterium]
MNINKIISGAVQAAALGFLFVLTLMDVEVRWSAADGALAEALPVFGAVAAVCVMMQGKAVRMTWTDIFVAVWMAYWLLRLWVGAEYPCGTSATKVMQMCVLYVVLRGIFAGCGQWAAAALCALIAVGGVVESVWGIGQMIDGTSRHASYLLTGSFLNPGPYSGYVMMAAAVLLTIINYKLRLCDYKLQITNYLSYAQWAMLAVCLMVLPATWSRAAWVGLAVVGLWVFRAQWWRWRWWLLAGGVALAMMLYVVKQGSAEGRLIIWASALTSWLHSPWWGVGIGGFSRACADGLAEIYQENPLAFHAFRSAGVTEYSFNAPLQVLVEQGAVGLLLAVAAVASAMMRMWRVCRPLAAGMVSLLVFACFGYPFEMLPYCILAVTAGAVCAGWNADDAEGTDKDGLSALGRSRWASFAMKKWQVAGVIVLFSLGAVPLANEVERRTQSATDASLMTGMNDAFFLKDFWELLPDEMDNPRFLFQMAKLLADVGRWRDSNAILRMGTEVSGDPMFYVLQGNNYREMGLLDDADAAYQRALAIMPNRMYPLYRRMLLRAEMGDTATAVALAEKITSMQPKIESPATREMQETARRFIESGEIVADGVQP